MPTELNTLFEFALELIGATTRLPDTGNTLHVVTPQRARDAISGVKRRDERRPAAATVALEAISPPAYSWISSARSGSGPGVMLALDVHETALRPFHVAEGPRGRAPHERAEGGRAHEDGHEKLAEGQIFEHAGLSFISGASRP